MDIDKLLEERKADLKVTYESIQQLSIQLQQAKEQALILKGAIKQLEELKEAKKDDKDIKK